MIQGPVFLQGARVVLRPWRHEDREPCAAMNADPYVMEFFVTRLDRAESDALVDRFREHFTVHGFGLWAIEVPGVAPFIGFTGLEVPRFDTLHGPCVEIGWRLVREHWGRGYATEAARLALDYGFGTLGLPEILGTTAVTNRRSRAVMERLGMDRDPSDDFDHPLVPAGHPLRRHVLYRIAATRPKSR